MDIAKASRRLGHGPHLPLFCLQGRYKHQRQRALLFSLSYPASNRPLPSLHTVSSLPSSLPLNMRISVVLLSVVAAVAAQESFTATGVGCEPHVDHW
jgi:hypothetical protein